MGLETRGQLIKVDKFNAWNFWRHHPESYWITNGYCEPLCLLCLGLLSELLIPKNKSVKDLEGMMVKSVYQKFNIQVGFLIYHPFWMVHRFSEIALVVRWDQPSYTHPNRFGAPM